MICLTVHIKLVAGKIWKKTRLHGETSGKRFYSFLSPPLWDRGNCSYHDQFNRSYDLSDCNTI